MRARQRSRPTTHSLAGDRALILAAVLFCGGAVTVTLVRGSTAGKGAAARDQSAAAIGRRGAAARTAAAAWMARQVDPAAIVACDPQMCAVLQSKGIPAGRLLLLGAGNAGPLGSDVIVSTAAVREEFGSRLTSVYAPVALATFGSGSAQVSGPGRGRGWVRRLPAQLARGCHRPARGRCAAAAQPARARIVLPAAANWPPGRWIRGCSALIGTLAAQYHVRHHRLRGARGWR